MKNLQELISSKDNLVDYFRNDSIAHYFKSRASLFAKYIPLEFTNWREEQRAWRETVVLFDQTHHMPVLTVKGPDAKRLLNYLSPCTFTNLSVNRAKQYIASNSQGYHIGDCILYYHGEEQGFELISGMFVLNWIRFHGETAGYDVEMSFDPTTPFHPTGERAKYRFQIEGPNARKVMEEVCEGGWPEIKFFHTDHVQIAGCRVQVLRHGMAGHAGAELSGPLKDMNKIRDAILKAGGKHGLRQAGTRAYYSTPIEDGWMPYPLPAIYTSEDMRAFREWLPADGWEGSLQIGGSFYSDNIEDYYSTPWSLGYERLVKFDHDFIGREALEASRDRPSRRKRSLRWNAEDVRKVMDSQFNNGPRYKSIELPTPDYGFPQADEVRSVDGKLIGISQYCAYTYNERAMVSLASIDEDFAEIGTEVVLTWGERDGGSRKPHVERHEQTTIRATVAPIPYSSVAQEKLRAAI